MTEEMHNEPCFHSFIKWDCLSCLEGALWRCNEAYQEEAGRTQYVINWLNKQGLLEEGCFTFPDGDTWRADEV